MKKYLNLNLSSIPKEIGELFGPEQLVVHLTAVD